jgi:hypothetical protein
MIPSLSHSSHVIRRQERRKRLEVLEPRNKTKLRAASEESQKSASVFEVVGSLGQYFFGVFPGAPLPETIQQTSEFFLPRPKVIITASNYSFPKKLLDIEIFARDPEFRDVIFLFHHL